MSTLTIHLPEPLDATLAERVKTSGARSKEEYLLGLVESDCATGTLERVLVERMAGPFAPFEPGWKEQVRAQQERTEMLRHTHGVLDEADGEAFEQAMDDARRIPAHG